MALYEWEEIPQGSGSWRRTDTLRHPGESPCLRGCSSLPTCDTACLKYTVWKENLEAYNRQNEDI